MNCARGRGKKKRQKKKGPKDVGQFPPFIGSRREGAPQGKGREYPWTSWIREGGDLEVPIHWLGTNKKKPKLSKRKIDVECKKHEKNGRNGKEYLDFEFEKIEGGGGVPYFKI